MRVSLPAHRLTFTREATPHEDIRTSRSKLTSIKYAPISQKNIPCLNTGIIDLRPILLLLSLIHI